MGYRSNSAGWLGAFHPEAALQCLSGASPDRVIIRRGTGDETLWAVHNLSRNRIDLNLRTLAKHDQWCDRLQDSAAVPNRLTIAPFSVHWLQPC